MFSRAGKLYGVKVFSPVTKVYVLRNFTFLQAVRNHVVNVFSYSQVKAIVSSTYEPNDEAMI